VKRSQQMPAQPHAVPEQAARQTRYLGQLLSRREEAIPLWTPPETLLDLCARRKTGTMVTKSARHVLPADDWSMWE
jgi:hypothetical protein